MSASDHLSEQQFMPITAFGKKGSVVVDDSVNMTDRQKVYRLSKQMRSKGYDQTKPVLVWQEHAGMRLADGHHRVRAARNAGISEVPYEMIDRRPTQDAVTRTQSRPER